MKEKPNLLYITPSISREIGGIFEVERNLSIQLHKKGVFLEVISLIDKHTDEDILHWLPVVPTCFQIMGPKVIGYNANIYKQLLASKANIGHIHSLWSYTTFALFKWANKMKYPFMITINGMLDEWAINHSKWKKDIALRLGVRKILNQASCIHVNTIQEYHSVRKFGLKNPICVITNGVNLPNLSLKRKAPWNEIDSTKGKKILLFLGRIHHKKGVHNLLEAWNNLQANYKTQMND